MIEHATGTLWAGKKEDITMELEQQAKQIHHVKVHYDNNTGEILGYYPSNLDYKNIPTPFIEIDTDSHVDCYNNTGERMVCLNKKIIKVETFVKVFTKEELLLTLKTLHEADFDTLSKKLSLATLVDDLDKIEEIKAEYKALKLTYDSEVLRINSGN